MFWISKALSLLGGALGGLPRIASWVLVGAVLLGGILVFGYQLGEAGMASQYEVAVLEAQLEAEREGRRKEREARAHLRRTIEKMQSREKEIAHATPVPVAAGADCPVGDDFVLEILAGYQGPG